jgi:hypothetical protein
MKKLISHDLGTCVFSPTAKTITFSGVTLTQEQILLITNTTDGIIIYNFADATKGGVLAGGVLTLAYDTTQMGAGDALQIYVDIPEYVDAASLYADNIVTTGAGAAIDTTSFAAITIQLTGTWSGVLFIEGSNDASATSWSGLPLMPPTELAMQDSISANGLYVLKTTTRYIRYNVSRLTGTIVLSVVGRESEGVRGSDRLAFALDESTGVRLSVSIKNLCLDQYGAMFISDAPEMRRGAGNLANAILFTIDTSGYQSISLQLSGTWAGTVTFQASNDGATWVSVAGWNSATGVAAVVTTTTSGLFSIPCVGRLFRAVETAYTSGLVNATAFLRFQPASPMLAAPSIAANSSVNVAQWAGTPGPTAGVAGVVATGGNVAVGAVQTAYPVVVAGVDALGKTRRLLTDAAGMTALPSVPTPAGIQNLAAQAMVDTSQVEGQSLLEILAQVLVELKIANWYHFDLPRQLQSGTAFTSDEPSAFRNDPTMLNP